MRNTLLIVIYLFFVVGCSSQQSNIKYPKVLNLVANEYVKDLNRTALDEEAVKGLVKRLDSHSRYLTKEDLQNFLIAKRGTFGGVGIVLTLREGLLTVVRTIADTPAAHAGIQPDDTILKINDHATLGLSIEEAVALTRGKIGTPLKLTIYRKGERYPLLFTIKRAYIHPKPLFATLLPEQILYISIPNFNDHTAQELYAILKRYHDPKAIILDLRYNPGGVLSQAVAVADMFIDHGLILTQKGRQGRYYASYRATPSMMADRHTPVAVLINGMTASGAEIVTGTLKLYKRATIIGEKSFGKGSVQTLFPLDDHSALKLTVAKYYLADGKCIDGIGIAPDIAIKNSTLKQKNKQSAISPKAAKALLGKLNTHTIPVKTGQPPKRAAEKPLTLSPEKIRRDRQLTRAIRLLRSSS